MRQNRIQLRAWPRAEERETDQVVEEAVININSRHTHTHDFLSASQYPKQFLLEASFTV